MKIAGAVYLVWLGIRSSSPPPATIQHHRPSRRADDVARTYRQGVIVNVLFQPGQALFFLAFLPQFVDPDGSTAASSPCSASRSS